VSFQQAHPDGLAVPRIVEKSLAAAQAFNAGALLVADSSDNYAECGADPAAIGAVAVSGAGSDTSGFNRFAKKEFPPGKMQGITLPGIVFTCKYVGTLPAANGASYGVVRDTDSDWKADFTELASPVLTLVGRRTDSPENIARVVVVFLSGVIQAI
jgi:hypothetical protein